MNSHAQLPPEYRASKSSGYRRRIAALSTPVPEEMRKRIQFGKALWKAAPNPEGIWGHPLKGRNDPAFVSSKAPLILGSYS